MVSCVCNEGVRRLRNACSAHFREVATDPPPAVRVSLSRRRRDAQSKGLISAWINSPFAKGVFKDRLDEGMARSIFDSERRLAEMAVQQIYAAQGL